MWPTGINSITGIIPACQDNFDSDNFSIIRAPIDHYSVIKGNPDNITRCRPVTIPKVGSLVGIHKPAIPTYSTIELQTTIHDPDNYDILHTAEISPGMDVLLNGVLIASAPENKQMITGKNKKLTQTERARFCRGVVWWLMNDQTCLKDKLSEIGYNAPAPIPAHEAIQDTTITPVKQYPFPIRVYPEGWINHLRLSITEVPA